MRAFFAAISFIACGVPASSFSLRAMRVSVFFQRGALIGESHRELVVAVLQRRGDVAAFAEGARRGEVLAHRQRDAHLDLAFARRIRIEDDPHVLRAGTRLATACASTGSPANSPTFWVRQRLVAFDPSRAPGRRSA